MELKWCEKCKSITNHKAIRGILECVDCTWKERNSK